MYCTEADLIARFGDSELVELTDFAHQGVIDSSLVATAISDASNEIDTYLSGRYDLPLTEAPAVLVAVSVDMARYYLYGTGVPEYVSERYKARIEYLGRVSRGMASLPLPEASQPQTEDVDGIKISHQGHDWARGIGGFGV